MKMIVYLYVVVGDHIYHIQLFIFMLGINIMEFDNRIQYYQTKEKYKNSNYDRKWQKIMKMIKMDFMRNVQLDKIQI